MAEQKQKSLKQFILTLENDIGGIALLVLALLPLFSRLFRVFFKAGIPDYGHILRNLTVFVAFVSGMIASREGEHLSLGSNWKNASVSLQRLFKVFTSVLGASISIAFAFASFSFLVIAFDPSLKILWIPLPIFLSIMPLGFFLIALRFILREDLIRKKTFWLILGCVIGILFSIPSITNLAFTFFPNAPFFLFNITDTYYLVFSVIKWPVVILLIGAGICGAPIFVLLGGISYVLFSGNWGALEVLPNEAYVLFSDQSIPAIPIFTLAGFILSQSKSGERLVRVFKSLLGWLPGGAAIIAVTVSAFFTTFTGASGVTILALGGLLFVVLTQSGGYSKKFSRGLLTSSGSIGLLFPPSLPIIMYGVVAQINIKHLFIGGIIPGLILVLALSVTGVVAGLRSKEHESFEFNGKEILKALRDSIGELMLPVIIIVFFFTGLADLVETASIAVLYTIILEVFIKKDIKLKDLTKVVFKCLPIIGGILIILAMAKGLQIYIVDAEVPMLLTGFFSENIHSKFVFLILLNVLLLITGCLMDIYSAILVVAPLVIPLGAVYGVHPVQLGIIFLANLELGYLTPPVGLNLFLASYSFKTPLVKIYKSVGLFFLILLAMILLITFVPWFSTAFISLLG